MYVLPFLAFLLGCLTVVYGGFLPEYNDPIHGELIVSRRKPPFLTLKAYPEREYYFPTNQQVAEIRRAVYGRAYSFPRSGSISNSTGFEAKLRLKREIDNFSPDDFDAYMKDFNQYSKLIGQMILSMFKASIYKEPMADPNPMIFTTSNEKTYFKATIVGMEEMQKWLVTLRVTLEAQAVNLPFFPVDKVLNELQECRHVGYSQVTDKDFKFESGETGSMSYYRVRCMRMKSTVFVFMALNQNAFKLDDVEVQHARTCTAYNRHCSWFCWFSWHSSYSYNCPYSTKEARTLTAAQQRELNEYLIDKVVQSIKRDHKDEIDAANENYIFF